MSLYKIVIGEVQGDRCLKVLTLLTEGQREASEPPHVKAGGRVEPLNVAGRNSVYIGIANKTFFFSVETISGALYLRLG